MAEEVAAVIDEDDRELEWQNSSAAALSALHAASLLEEGAVAAYYAAQVGGWLPAVGSVVATHAGSRGTTGLWRPKEPQPRVRRGSRKGVSDAGSAGAFRGE